LAGEGNGRTQLKQDFILDTKPGEYTSVHADEDQVRREGRGEGGPQEGPGVGPIGEGWRRARGGEGMGGGGGKGMFGASLWLR
jgi:hypothetical protein